jgi:hypothetical protein
VTRDSLRYWRDWNRMLAVCFDVATLLGAVTWIGRGYPWALFMAGVAFAFAVQATAVVWQDARDAT